NYQVNEDQLRFYRRVRDELAQARRALRAIRENPSISVTDKRLYEDAITLGMLNLARVALEKPPITIDSEGRFTTTPSRRQGGMAQTIQEALSATGSRPAPSQGRTIQELLQGMQ